MVVTAVATLFYFFIFMSSHTFSQVPKAQIQRSSFDRSSSYKTTFDSGYLVPFFVDEALPGDTFNLQMSSVIRLATPLFPFMDNLYRDTFYFAVPYRLVWDNWQKFNGEQRNPGDSTDYIIPQMVSPAGGYQVGSLSDFFGIPTEVEGLSHMSLVHRAYNLIWNEWFRDENLQDSVDVSFGDGPDDPADFTLLRRGKRHDYFTSCLPWPQKGPSVDIPLGQTAPVISDGNTAFFSPTPGSSGAAFYADTNDFVRHVGYNTSNLGFGSQTGLEVDLSTATAATINQLREAFQIQKLYERDARGGTRYTEILKSHFGVTSPDARLQRPEFLGGDSEPFYIKPIPQTSSTDAESPQGNLAAYGISTSSGRGFVKSFTEHCIVIGLISVRADLSYQQGLNRMWSRQIRWDFYWPALAHLGEQAVLNKEIYAQGSADSEADEAVFGYQERFAEYRYKPSLITGQFRSSYAQSLDAWHLSQDFASLPVLNDEFIVDNPPVDRVVAVPSAPQFLLDMYIKLKCARPMPVYGVPGLIDHF